MDFIGPLSTIKSDNSFIFNIVCYLSKKVVPFATKTANSSDSIAGLRKCFSMFRRPQVIYCDRGQHFDNPEMRAFRQSVDVAIIYFPFSASKSTGMIEVSNRLLEDVLRKQGTKKWDEVTCWGLSIVGI